MKKQKPILHDPMIIPRVKQYLEENVHQTYVDVGVMARALQSRHREYERRKAAPFKALVEEAYKTVLHSYGLDSNPSSDNDGDGGNSDLEVMDESSSNHMNNMLTNMYTKNHKKSATSDNDPIDILSSDESDSDKAQQAPVRKFPEKPPTNELVITKLSLKDGNANEGEKRVLASFPQQPMKKRKIDTGGSANTTEASNGEKTVNLPAAVTIHKIRKGKKLVAQIRQPGYTFRDIGGMEKILKELCELLFPMKHPEVYHQLGVAPPRGFLLHGPPGCGKTLLAHAIAGQLNVGLLEIAATELISGVSGDSEERIRDLFEQAVTLSPCVLFIDEIDAISSNRVNAQRDMERRIVSQLLSSFDSLARNANAEQVIVVGATTNPDSVDPALRRIGRFDHEISIGIPDRDEREAILMTIIDGLSVEAGFDYRIIAELTPGYVGADLVALSARAASIAIKRCFEREYRIHQAKFSENIPIVDLDAEDVTAEGENMTDKTEKATGKAKETVDEAKETSEEAEETADKAEKTADNATDQTEKDAETTSGNEQVEEEETVSSEKEKDDQSETEKSDKVNGEVPAETVEATSEEKTENDENDEPTETAADDEKEEGAIDETEGEEMDVDDVQPESPKEETKKSEENDGTIDLDELPDDTPATVAKHSRRHELTLFEMMSWLNLDCPPISPQVLELLFITVDDFKEAVALVKPSAKREGFITVPDVTWDDIGSLKNVREELKLAVLAPVKFPEKLKALGITTPAGVLLCGPPGCGKTLIAKAIANEAGINFISVKGPELMNMYVGESEKAVRQCFQRARNSAPCVIFFDEFDSLCPKRSDITEGASSTRVVNQLLTEMDGIEERKGVFLMAASNRPDIIDPAVLRPGRLDKVIYIDLPNESDRTEILQALTKKRTKPNLAEDVSFENIASRTSGFTGADLAGLVRQASLLALKDSLDKPNLKPEELFVSNSHFTEALRGIKPSVSQEERRNYERLRTKYAQTDAVN